MAQGYHLSFSEKKKDIFINDLIYFTPSIEATDPVVRLKELYLRYQPIAWGVFRRRSLIKTWDMVSDKDCHFFNEMAWSSGATINGKIKRLDNIFCFRRAGPTHLRGHPVFGFLDNPETFVHRYLNFKTRLCNNLQTLKLMKQN